MWWLTDGLTADPRGLHLDGVSLAEVAALHGTPTYVYGAQTLRARARAMVGALPEGSAVWYALKANRFPGVLEVLRSVPGIGIDACSPREVEHALAAGFGPEEISVTAGMLSDRDLRAFAEQGVHLNLDTRSVLRRFAAIVPPGTRVGLRINPEVRVGWDDHLAYGGSKFGFDAEDVLDAAAWAWGLGLVVDTLHIHPGWGLPASAEPSLRQVLRRMAGWAAALPTVRTLDVGGGLAPRYRPEDDPLALEDWADLVAEELGPTGCRIGCEPGTWLVAAAGVLLVEVNTVERRRSGTWIGVDAGHAVNVFAAHYGIPMAIVPVSRPLDPPVGRFHIAGNINEANDVFARDRALAKVREGELLAILPAGAYGASMASDHCLRGRPGEVLVG
jgi:diaminopimelate decarboxylase